MNLQSTRLVTLVSLSIRLFSYSLVLNLSTLRTRSTCRHFLCQHLLLLRSWLLRELSLCILSCNSLIRPSLRSIFRSSGNICSRGVLSVVPLLSRLCFRFQRIGYQRAGYTTSPRKRSLQVSPLSVSTSRSLLRQQPSAQFSNVSSLPR